MCQQVWNMLLYGLLIIPAQPSNSTNWYISITLIFFYKKENITRGLPSFASHLGDTMPMSRPFSKIIYFMRPYIDKSGSCLMRWIIIGTATKVLGFGLEKNKSYKYKWKINLSMLWWCILVKVGWYISRVEGKLWPTYSIKVGPYWIGR